MKKERRETGELYELQATSESNTSQLKKWFLLLDVATSSRKRALLPVKKLRNSLITNSKLHRTLYGFIVFEVAWSDVRGINYFNELQVGNIIAIHLCCTLHSGAQILSLFAYAMCRMIHHL